jgi:hypothetical protein
MRCSTVSAAGATVDELLIGFQISRPEVDGGSEKGTEKYREREKERVSELGNIWCRKTDENMT